jgi:hypothetical protein
MEVVMPARTPQGHCPGLSYTVPGMSEAEARSVIEVLQDRLNALTDLHLTLKHVHWNVVGPFLRLRETPNSPSTSRWHRTGATVPEQLIND